jgi:phosphate transport system permease protein
LTRRQRVGFFPSLHFIPKNKAFPVIPPTDKSGAVSGDFDIRRKRGRLLGLNLDDVIRHFFEGNAVVSIVVLALITLFLFKEGADFFEQNRTNLKIYREAGLECVDYLKTQEADHTALVRYLSDLRVKILSYHASQGLSLKQAQAQLVDFDAFSDKVGDAITPLRRVLGGSATDDVSLGDLAIGIKTKFLVAEDRLVEREQLRAAGKIEQASKVKVDVVDFKKELAPLLAIRPAYKMANREVASALKDALRTAPRLPAPELDQRLARFCDLAARYVAQFPEIERKVDTWDYTAPVPWHQAISAFIFGRDWLTASFWQDWYGVIPLFVGSLMVSLVALFFAVPFGVAAAIYANQMAGLREQRFIKPCIEFISAFPSVVLGFFGIAVLGQALRALSQVPWLSWVPGFPFVERLNIITAGCLLALIAVPTIFTLAEDALNNVPRALKEASFALGATKLQTILRVIAPAALSGIISAVLLGFGRVIGETMVVLLCAGNRIAIPDFSAGIGVVGQPVHTMTGIIAQEMGEVARGSIHYRALFVVGIFLFFLSLLINYVAQKLVRRYRLAPS